MRPSRIVSAAVLSLALAAPAVASADAITGGTTTWGVKQSFRNYVTGGIAAGSITTSDGATQSPPASIGNGGGPFSFPIISGQENAATSVATRGRVRFTGHAGQLDFTIFNVRVVLDSSSDKGPCLIADADTRSFGSTTVEQYRDVRFAKLDTTGRSAAVSGADTTWTDIPAVLTEEGAPAFAGFYSAGTALDPVSFTYQKTAGAGTAAGACQAAGSVTPVTPQESPAPGSAPAASGGGSAPLQPAAAAPKTKATVKAASLTRGQRRLLAKGRAVTTRVRVNTPGVVTLVAKARIGRSSKTVSRVRKRARKAGLVSLTWRLDRTARRQLARKGKLTLTVAATFPGATSSVRTVRLTR